MNLYIGEKIINNVEELRELIRSFDFEIDDNKRQSFIDQLVSAFVDDRLIPWVNEEGLYEEVAKKMQSLYNSYTPGKSTDSQVFRSLCNILASTNTEIFYKAKDYISVEDIHITLNGHRIAQDDFVINKNTVSPGIISIQYSFKVKRTLNETFKFKLVNEDLKSLSRDIEVNISGALAGSIVYSNVIEYKDLHEFFDLNSGIHSMYLLELSHLEALQDSSIHIKIDENLDSDNTPISILFVSLIDNNNKIYDINPISRKALIDVNKQKFSNLRVLIKYQINSSFEQAIKISTSLFDDQDLVVNVKDGQKGKTGMLNIPISVVYDKLKSGEYLFKINQTNRDDLKIVFCVYGEKDCIIIDKNNSIDVVSGYDEKGLFYLSKGIYRKITISPDYVIKDINELNTKYKDNFESICFSLPSSNNIKQLSNYIDKAESYEYTNSINENLLSKDTRYAVRTENVGDFIEVPRNRLNSNVSYRLKITLAYEKTEAINIESNCISDDYTSRIDDWFLERTFHYD